MRAITAYGPKNFVLEEVSSPSPAPYGWVLDVEIAGVCAADRMLWRGDGPWSVKYPFIPGHEIVGRIVEAGPHADAQWQLGDRVAVEVMVPCGVCLQCRSGRENLCEGGSHLGSDLPGAFAERIAIPAAAKMHAVPETISSPNAAGIEMLANALHAIERAELCDGGTVAVIGIGAVGAAVVKATRAIHPTAHVIAVINRAERLDFALSLGAEEVFVSGTVDAASRLEELCQRRAPSRVMEMSGSTAGAQLAFEMVRPGGRVCLYGVYRHKVELDLNLISEHKELDVAGGHLAPNGAFKKAIDMLAQGAVELDQVVGRIVPLQSFEALLAARDGLKSAFMPNNPMRVGSQEERCFDA